MSYIPLVSPLNKAYFYEDFYNCKRFNLLTASNESVPVGTSTWVGGAVTTDGQIFSIDGEESHPGVARLFSANTTNASSWIRFGTEDEGNSGFPFLVSDIDEIEIVARITNASDYIFFFGLVNNDIAGNAPASEYAVGFYKDTSVSSNVYVTCRSTTATNTDSGLDTTTLWAKYNIVQSAPGEFSFYINNTFITTITTDVPSSSILPPLFYVEGLDGNDKSFDIDYIYVSTKKLGNRFDV